MSKYRYKKVNAFTSGVSKGNPAAYFMSEQPLSPEAMLQIGKEHAGFVSEVVFCTPSQCADCKLTYYSSQCEVEFCGHGTIAAMYDIIANDPRLRAKPEVRIETNKKGLLTVYNAIDKDNAIYITAPAPQFLPLIVSRAEAAQALGLTEADLDAELPLDFIDAGLRTLLVPIKTLETEISVFPAEAQLKEFCRAHGIDIILIFSHAVQNAARIAHTRVFAPKFGYLEDPATGSGNSAFANYMLKHGLWDGSAASVEQGGNDREFNPVMLKYDGENVLFGGAASVVIEGWYFV